MRAREVEARFGTPGTRQLIVLEAREQARHGCAILARGLNDLLPDGREKALAFTHLETVLFWALAAVDRTVDDPSEAAPPADPGSG